MTNIVPIHQGDQESAQALIASFQQQGMIKRKALNKSMPSILEHTLGLLLNFDDPRGYETACRILAATIARLKA